MFKEKITDTLYIMLKDYLSKKEIMSILEEPSNQEFGDFSFPTFTLVKLFKKSPQAIAEHIHESLESELIESVEVINGFVNLKIDKEIGSSLVMKEIQGNDYGTTDYLTDTKIVMDFSSPNIAKPFSMGHLRATVLGDSLSRILKKNGAEIVGINHVGDWGTQFGKLIVAYKIWGNEKSVERDPIKELFELYKKFHIEAEQNQNLDDEARKAFYELENGDSEYLTLWDWFREVSMESFQKLYEQLGISFDYIQGESFYNDRMEDTIKLLEEKGLLEYDEGAYIIRLKDVPPALIKKKDGSSLYITRDLSAMFYREAQFQPDKILYVVGHEQSVHFGQLSQLSKILDTKSDIEHIPFGLILTNGKKMSTRKGKVVFLENIIEDLKKISFKIISEKNPNLKQKEMTAEKIAIGAIKFYDLKNDRMNSYNFNMNDMLKFDGETATYIMYTNSRIQSILRNGKLKFEETFIFEESMWPLLKQLSQYEEDIMDAADRYSPAIICKYVLQLCRLFNSYYAQVRIKDSDNENSKLLVLYYVSKNIKDAMQLLGIETVDEM